MFTKVEEIWWTPFANELKNGGEVPEIVRRVNEAVFDIAELYRSDMTDEELLLKGIDPDMVNEFCMFNQDEWPEMEKYYQDENCMYIMDNAEQVGTKQYRAQQIWAGLDPETEKPIGYVEYEPTYEEWKASLGIGALEVPHSVLGSNHNPQYVRRLIEEQEMRMMMMENDGFTY